MKRFAIATLCLSVTTACGEEEGGRGGGTFPGGVPMNTSGITASGSGDGFDDGGDDDDGDDDDGLKLDVQGGNADGGGEEAGDDGCQELTDEAEVGPRPQDIIVVIDTSGSMSAEAAFVQAQMNSFSIQIEAANVDSHIILISNNEVCLAPPLGSGGCPGADSNPPDYFHLDQTVGSSNALQLVLDRYDDYSAHLRPTAVTHLVVVTDDDSNIDAPTFISQFVGLSPHLSDFVAHGIIAPEDPFLACQNMTTCCGLAADRGTVYQALIQATGGVEGNLCEQEFQPIFQAVAQVVIGGASLSCSFEIPPAPLGETFDQNEVNVEFDDGAGGTLEIGRVDSAAMCAGVSNGWYYDNPADPQVIVLCPQTCGEVQGFASASIGIIFGCATIPAG